MAIKIGNDGTLFCNTVRYNYKQARNLIADGSGGNMSGIWTFGGGSKYESEIAGYKTKGCFNIKYGNENMLSQILPKLDLSHKYYVGYKGKSNSNPNAALRIQNGSTNLFEVYFGINTNGNWVTFSNYYNGTGSGVVDASLNFAAYGSEFWVSKFIMVDLTDTFGAGYEPSKGWCDENIREWEVITNYGCLANTVNKDNIATEYKIVNATPQYFNYLQLDSRWEPREYMLMMNGWSDVVEGYIYSSAKVSLDNQKDYYASVYYHRPHAAEGINYQSIEFYWPIAEPSLGGCPIVDAKNFNGGGGMWEWKLASVLNNRSMFANDNFDFRYDFNNINNTNDIRLTAINLQDISSNIDAYNAFCKTNISKGDINVNWCDRWIDGRSSPIIHIKDPNKIDIEFNTEYDVVCNDIEIRPEMNSVTFDKSTGTIYCKKLIKNQNY